MLTTVGLLTAVVCIYLLRLGPHPQALLAAARPASGRLPRMTDF